MREGIQRETSHERRSRDVERVRDPLRLHHPGQAKRNTNFFRGLFMLTILNIG